LSATFFEKDGNMNMAITFLIHQYLSSESPILQEIFLDRLTKVGLSSTASLDTASQYPIFSQRKSQLSVLLPKMKGHVQTESTLVKLVADMFNHTVSSDGVRFLETLGVPYEAKPTPF
jgi:hypothetical protein